MSPKEIIDALNGYKDGSYGGALKATMVANAKRLNDAQIEDLAKFISK